MKILNNLAEAKTLVGEELGLSEWQKISQKQISEFGKVTGDQQWIHTAPIKAKMF